MACGQGMEAPKLAFASGQDAGVQQEADTCKCPEPPKPRKVAVDCEADPASPGSGFVNIPIGEGEEAQLLDILVLEVAPSNGNSNIKRPVDVVAGIAAVPCKVDDNLQYFLVERK